MAKKPPIEDREILAAMESILAGASAFCREGVGGMHDEKFRNAVMNAFKDRPDDVRIYVFNNLPVLQATHPFQFVPKNGNGEPAVCMIRPLKKSSPPESGQGDVTREVLKSVAKTGTAAKKSAIVDTIDDKTPEHITQKDIELVFDALRKTIAEHLAVGGIFEMTGLFKLEAITKEDGAADCKFTARKTLNDAAATHVMQKQLQEEMKTGKTS